MIKTNLFTALLAICLVMVSCSKEQKLENDAQPTFETKDAAAQVCDGGDDDEVPMPMFQGQISNAEGFPVHQACVEVWTSDGLQMIGGTGTDERGHFRFSTLPTGEFLVKAHKGASVTEGYIVMDTEPVTLNLVLY